MDRIGMPTGVMTMDRPRPALLPPSLLRPLAGWLEDWEEDDNEIGPEEEPEALLTVSGGRCELCGFLRCTCVSGLLVGLALLLAASAPEAPKGPPSSPCPDCQGHGGRTRTEYQGTVRRVWWETCESCRGAGVALASLPIGPGTRPDPARLSPEASGECPNCGGAGGWSDSEYRDGASRTWWKTCGSCSGTGRR